MGNSLTLALAFFTSVPVFAGGGTVGGTPPQVRLQSGSQGGGTPPSFRYDFKSLEPALALYEQIRLAYPGYTIDEIEEILKTQNSEAPIEDVFREGGGFDLDYAGVVEGINPYNFNLTEGEKRLFNDSPLKGLAVVYVARTALKVSQELYIRDTLEDGNGDAFRHCFWNMLMVKDVGNEFAKAWGDAHEEYPGNKALSKQMDLRNNADGRRLAVRYTSDSEEDRRNRCMSAVDNKKLIRIIGGTLLPTDSTGKL